MIKDKKRLAFSQNLVNLRKERGLSQQDLADRTNLTQRMIVYYENEAVKPPIDKLEVLAKALNVEITDLLGTKQVTEIQKELTQIDARTLKKMRTILSLPKHQRHIIYSMAESFAKQNQDEEKQ